MDYTDYHFWVDAKRPASGDPDTNYTWSTNATLPVGTNQWEAGEPDVNESYVGLRNWKGVWKYRGRKNIATRCHPLCQSVLSSTPKLDWVDVGYSDGYSFAFVTEPRSLTGAREACDQQWGGVQLATFKSGVKGVAEFIAHRYPRQSFWVDAVGLKGYESSGKFQWRTGDFVRSKYIAESYETALLLTLHRDTRKADGDGNGDGDDKDALVEAPDFLAFPYICQRLTSITSNVETPNITEMFHECSKGETQPYSSSSGGTQSPTTVATTMTTTTTRKTTEAEDTSSTMTKGCGKDNRTMMMASSNMTREELREVVKAIHGYLTVNTSTLSATIRKKTSAQDHRHSAQTTGAVGLLVLLIVFLLIVVPDLISALQSVTSSNNKISDTARQRCHDGVQKDSMTSRGVTSA